MMKRIRVLIEGRVQGVNFRFNCRKEAITCNIRGWVRNCEDGRVEAVFEGEEADIDKILRWCQKGTYPAAVKNLEIYNEPYSGESIEFIIRY